MQAQGLTRCLFLSADHRHRWMSGRLSGSSDPQPTITRYQDRGHSQTFRIEPKVGSNFPDPVAHCVLPTLGRQRKQWNFLPPIYDQSPSWLLDSCHRAIHHSSHTKQSCAPPFYLFVCRSHPGCRTHPPPGIHWNWPASQKSVTAFQVQLPSLASYILHWKSALRPALDSLREQTRAFCGRSINQTDSPIERKEAATRKCLSVFFPWLGLPHETVWFSQIKDSFEGILVFVHN